MMSAHKSKYICIHQQVLSAYGGPGTRRIAVRYSFWQLSFIEHLLCVRHYAKGREDNSSLSSERHVK